MDKQIICHNCIYSNLKKIKLSSIFLKGYLSKLSFILFD